MAEFVPTDVHEMLTSATDDLDTPPLNVNAMKTMFESKLQEVLSRKNRNTQIMTKANYMDMIRKIEKVKSMTNGKKPEDYVRLKKYYVDCYNGVKRLVDPRSHGKDPKDLLQLVHTEEMFDIIHEAHLATNHGGRNRLGQKLKTYKNITREIVTLYIETCSICEQKRRPIQTEPIERRTYVDFIEVPNHCDYKYILVHEDYNTRFVQLRPSKTKCAKETAKHLMDIYTIFGPSIRLFSGMGQEFCKEVIAELYAMWPELTDTISYPNDADVPSYPSKVLLYSILEILQARLQQMNTGKWVNMLNIVQLTKNQTYNHDLKNSPYNVMFKSNLENKKNVRGKSNSNATSKEVCDNHGVDKNEDLEIPSTSKHDIKIKEEIKMEMEDIPDNEMFKTAQDGVTDLKTEPKLETSDNSDTESSFTKIEIEEDGWMAKLK